MKIKLLIGLGILSLILTQNISVLGANSANMQNGAVFESYSITTDVYETVAQTNVTQVYYNSGNSLVQGIFSIIKINRELVRRPYLS